MNDIIVCALFRPKGAESTLIGAYHHKKFARDVSY